MTIAQAIAKADALKHNEFSESQKIQMLSECDSAIFKEIFGTHVADDTTPTTFTMYGDSTDTDTELLVEAPYDILYIRWLHSQYDFYNQEIGRYNNSLAVYNQAYDRYANYYNRTHLPLQGATYVKVGGWDAINQTYSTDPI